MDKKFITVVVVLFPSPSIAIKPQYDTLKLSLQWSIAFCNTLEGKKDCNKLLSPVLENFKIHGLWHSLNNKIKSCDTRLYNRDRNVKINVFLSTLKQEWPDLKDLKLWNDEWKKHRSCHHFSPPEYFEIALELKSDLLASFYTRDSRPSKDEKYTLRQIEGAMVEATGYIPEIECNNDRYSYNQLYEIHLCFNPDKTTNNCNLSTWDTRCNSQGFKYVTAETLYRDQQKGRWVLIREAVANIRNQVGGLVILLQLFKNLNRVQRLSRIN